MEDNMGEPVAEINGLPIPKWYFNAKVAEAELKIDKFKQTLQEIGSNILDKQKNALTEVVEMGPKKWAWEQIKYEVITEELAEDEGINC